ncbi:MAG: hypothetical protein SP1CHLAM54_08210 [Chlamydiia bacterium]|nr:hypothetical protein [Chlamydiia bacterium]MCH9615727.1 hypothetical protein [Chlamydiia bacterium]MCH9628870.1 hypothetical protein [Chlamydiia bacterium]
MAVTVSFSRGTDLNGDYLQMSSLGEDRKFRAAQCLHGSIDAAMEFFETLSAPDLLLSYRVGETLKLRSNIIDDPMAFGPSQVTLLAAVNRAIPLSFLYLSGISQDDLDAGLSCAELLAKTHQKFMPPSSAIDIITEQTAWLAGCTEPLEQIHIPLAETIDSMDLFDRTKPHERAAYLEWLKTDHSLVATANKYHEGMCTMGDYAFECFLHSIRDELPEDASLTKVSEDHYTLTYNIQNHAGTMLHLFGSNCAFNTTKDTDGEVTVEILHPTRIVEEMKRTLGTDNILQPNFVFGYRKRISDFHHPRHRDMHVPHPCFRSPRKIHGTQDSPAFAAVLHDLYYHYSIDASIPHYHRAAYIRYSKEFATMGMTHAKIVLGDRDFLAYFKPEDHAGMFLGTTDPLDISDPELLFTISLFAIYGTLAMHNHLEEADACLKHILEDHPVLPRHLETLQRHKDTFYEASFLRALALMEKARSTAT